MPSKVGVLTLGQLHGFCQAIWHLRVPTFFSNNVKPQPLLLELLKELVRSIDSALQMYQSRAQCPETARARALPAWPGNRKGPAPSLLKEWEPGTKQQMLKMLTGIFQEQLHPTGEFCSQPCCPKPRLKKHSSPFWFCPASVPCLVNPG